MTIQLSSVGADEQIIVGFEGEYTVGDVQAFIDQMDGDIPITRLTLEIAPEERVSINPPQSMPSTGEDGASAPMAVETSARVQVDSVPYHILEVLVEEESPLRTEEIYEELTDLDLSQNAIASRLWNLYQRGLVDKRPYPEDNRQKVYTLTGRGVYAFEAANEREA